MPSTTTTNTTATTLPKLQLPPRNLSDNNIDTSAPNNSAPRLYPSLRWTLIGLMPLDPETQGGAATAGNSSSTALCSSNTPVVLQYEA
ncbi:hypothetical protein V495_06504 [Pseudogymnoascus sp. VKM F-4514 (FW-929)]|nr:hypothetical protein V495_06504 [Pseudogymnoascus sp. VKM F-4514 (FW-929)]KFY61423.1 hypothetical protein V497_02942 [Pseudogymnoascus sp. VKM F-4516 (FW-969)]